MRFYVGLHQPDDARHFPAGAFVSATRLRNRWTPVPAGAWLMDSGAFSALVKYGSHPYPVERYAELIRRFAFDGRLEAAVAEDYMVEPAMLALTGLSIAEHQRLTIERFDALTSCDTSGVPVMPVLQGFAPEDYVAHIRAYGTRLAVGARVGVGSVCKRQGKPAAVFAVLRAIKSERPDLRLHAFGLKLTSLADPDVRGAIYSADSMAWSLAARRQGRDGNDWREAAAFVERIGAL